jgi:nitrogen fixation NifU-like protein
MPIAPDPAVAAERIMDTKDFDFWQDHSLHYLEMAFRKDKRKILENPDGYGKRTGACGDAVEMYITVRKKRIQEVSYNANGCLNTHACANTIAFLAAGKTVDEAWEITSENVTDYLETLPAAEVHCAELAVGAFYLALSNYRELQHSPWKKLYQKR